MLKNLRLITRYFELSAERNITASIAIDLQCMMEDNHVGFTRDELRAQQCIYDMTVNMQLAIVSYHSLFSILFPKCTVSFYIKLY